jgi:chromate transport protein ChrA
VFKGVNASAVGLVFAAVYLLSQKAIVATSGSPGQSPLSITFSAYYTSIAIFSFSASGFLDVPAPLSILLGGIFGILAWASELCP